MERKFLGDFPVSPQGCPKVLCDTGFLSKARGREVLSGVITCAPNTIRLPQPTGKHKHLHLLYIIYCPSQDCFQRLNLVYKILHIQSKIFNDAEWYTVKSKIPPPFLNECVPWPQATTLHSLHYILREIISACVGHPGGSAC